MAEKSEILPKIDFETYLSSLPEHYTHHEFGHVSMTHGFIIKDNGVMIGMIYTEDGRNVCERWENKDVQEED